MARYISRSQAFKKKVIAAQSTIVNTPRGPESVESRAPHIALFRQGGATQREAKLALERFQFKGLSEKENPIRRISVYDTDEEAQIHGWTDEFKAEVEATLDAGPFHDYFKVEMEPAARPWNTYDEADPDEIAEIAQLIGVPFENVIAYERENKNRLDVIASLEASVPPAEVEIEA